MTTLDLILASSSRYRQAQLQSLGLAFRTAVPNIDEVALSHETPLSISRRLALSKALAVAKQCPASVVIGADQVLDLDGLPLGKPGSHDAATRQLRLLSGRVAYFHSAVSVISPRTQQVTVSTTRAVFRQLSVTQIESYLLFDRPYDTAGSAKAESLGIALLEELSSDDPSAIIGLPLIALTRLLNNIGIDPISLSKQG
ncbi:Maf family protein [Orrella marina]|uniref:7-methyl-GTP pyrophosphatase n=1 Tax=Orrella marina TaxID=2163011 RepID=A0A2R4XPI7_9BURK|nr:Maf family nucleotide pyrophosphatase [Orrella marina]AWB35733.1 septum formation protein Maf [Orrella marina]